MAEAIPQLGHQCDDSETNWKLCIICQDTVDTTLVLNPRIDSYQNLMSAVIERASFQDGKFVRIHHRLKDCTLKTLQTNNARYHRTCYADTTHKVELQRVRERYHHATITGASPRTPGRRSETCTGGVSTSTSSTPFTRSATNPFNREQCFFCQEDTGTQLFLVRTENAGESLRKAVYMSNNPALVTRLNTTISPHDAHAIDVRYHKQCWTQHVFHVLREPDESNSGNNQLTKQTLCFIELVNLIDVQTKNKAYLSMEDIEITYTNLLGGSDALANHQPTYNRQRLKDKIMAHLPNIRSVLQPNRRRSAVLYSPDACESEMVQTAITNDVDSLGNVYKTAQLIRSRIADFTTSKATTDSISVTSTVEDVPAELYSLIRWILLGSTEEVENKVRTHEMNRSSLTICQHIMYSFKSTRQVKYKPKSDSVGFRPPQTRVTPQAVGLALTVHHETRNKSLLKLLYDQNLCISYNRTMLLETGIANAVVDNADTFSGLYVPPFLKRGSFVFFAADNADFREDTADGRGTTHGTIMAVYQKADAPGEPLTPPLQISPAQNLTVKPHCVTILPCEKPKQKELFNENREKFHINTDGVSHSYQLTHFGWCLSIALSRMKDNGSASKIPGWAAYNSLISESKSITTVGALPLLPEVAHEWPTLLTVLVQARKMKDLTVGNDHPAVISFDMALYEKVVQLIDSRLDLQGTVFPRLGELHVVMAALRALGSSIENSGIDDSWSEGNVYGPATTRQILNCTHYKRCLRAHVYTYVALYDMLLAEFFKDNAHLKAECEEATSKVEDACSKKNDDNHESVKQAHCNLLQVLTNADILKKFREWEQQRSENAMFKSMTLYLRRVETILFFISASRNADVNLHLEAGEALSKLFFAMDRIKYKRLWPRYIADMHTLKTEHPATWKELELGNISVTKTVVPFVSIGADHACEHLNRFMKAQSGLIGISNNPNARQRFFLSSPELASLSSNFKDQFRANKHKATEHHEASTSATNQKHGVITKIKDAIMKHGNPFAVEGDSLYNMITHAFVPDEFVPTILNMDITGQKLYEDYVDERINGKVSLWAPVKKVNNKMYLSGNKKKTVSIRDKSVDLRETKDLYGRLMILSKSSRGVDQKHAISNYEFTVTPRALFAPNGSMLQCTDKAKLIHDLQKMIVPDTDTDTSSELPPENSMEWTSVDQISDAHSPYKIAVIDGMVTVQKLPKKKGNMATECFVKILMNTTRDYDEIILVFDTYKADSLKNNTRDKRRKGKDPIRYQVRDETKINHITLSRFLSHDETKGDLAEYLSEKTLAYNKDSTKVIITSASGKTKSNANISFEENNHEEADTLLIHQAVLATQRTHAPDVELVIFSPDTDVLVLTIANYTLLLKNTSIAMVSGMLPIQPIWTSLGAERAKALPAFHAFSGADNVGKFARHGKPTWFKMFLEAGGDVIDAFIKMSSNADNFEEILTSLEKFVCSVYRPKGVNIENIPDLRWELFCKHMAESDKLPPTRAALKQHLLRVRVQTNVWGQASVSKQEFLDPLQHGYHSDDGHLMPTTTADLPAPKAIIEMVRCQCKGDCLSQRCSCKSNELQCTDLCLCGTDCENDRDMQCENQDFHDDSDSEED